jgi:lipopolysaccharide transport system ATP-binding protein
MALAIKIEHLSKYYKLGVINNGRLWQDLQSYCARLLHREDPNRKIGEQTVYDRDGFWALSDINLEVGQGDRLGIMGHNGAGKSTLLKILSRITVPTQGCFHVKGRIVSLLEVGTGFHGELTGRENIYMNGAILGMKRREVTRKLEEIVAFSEIDPHHIDTPVKRYSSGMYVRLGFAIAAHLECEIMIADEVLAVGDLNFQQKATGKMSDLSTNHGRTVLFVSHNIGAVEKLCNKGLILEQGKVLLGQCPVEEAVGRYKEILGIA